MTNSKSGVEPGVGESGLTIRENDHLRHPIFAAKHLAEGSAGTLRDIISALPELADRRHPQNIAIMCNLGDELLRLVGNFEQIAKLLDSVRKQQ